MTNLRRAIRWVLTIALLAAIWQIGNTTWPVAICLSLLVIREELRDILDSEQSKLNKAIVEHLRRSGFPGPVIDRQGGKKV